MRKKLEAGVEKSEGGIGLVLATVLLAMGLACNGGDRSPTEPPREQVSFTPDRCSHGQQRLPAAGLGEQRHQLPSGGRGRERPELLRGLDARDLPCRLAPVRALRPGAVPGRGRRTDPRRQPGPRPRRHPSRARHSRSLHQRCQRLGSDLHAAIHRSGERHRPDRPRRSRGHQCRRSVDPGRELGQRHRAGRSVGKEGLPARCCRPGREVRARRGAAAKGCQPLRKWATSQVAFLQTLAASQRGLAAASQLSGGLAGGRGRRAATGSGLRPPVDPARMRASWAS